MRIRKAGPADLDAIDAIEAASFRGDSFPRRHLARLLLRSSAAFLVATEGRERIGYALLLFRKGAGAARLYSLATAPAARGRGVARALVDAAEALAVERGCGRLRLEVLSTNKAALRLYAKAGFSVIDTKQDYYGPGRHALHMEKRLEDAGEESRDRPKR